MPKFKFNLQAVLRQRQGVERQRQISLAGVERERLALEAELRECQARIDQERRELVAGLGAGGAARIDVHSVRLQVNASLRAAAHARTIAVRLAGVHARLDAKRSELLDAAKQRKAMDNLRDRRLAEWTKEQRSREAAVLDELAVIKAAVERADGEAHASESRPV